MYVRIPTKYLPAYHNCGLLNSEIPFLHAKRMNSDYLFIICTKGTLHLLIHDQPIDIQPHEAIIIPPLTPHCGRIPTENISFFWCHFMVNEPLRMYEKDENYKDPSFDYLPINEIIFPENFSRIYLFCQQMLDYSRLNPNEAEIINRFLIALLIKELKRQNKTNEKNAKIAKPGYRMDYIIEWVRINAYRRITIPEIAEKFHYNPNYLSNAFTKETGRSIKQYIIETRIDLSKEYLLLTDLSIREIAMNIGFCDDKYYMRMFKTKEKMTPTEYRNAFSHTHMQGHSSLTPSTQQNVEQQNELAQALSLTGRELSYVKEEINDNPPNDIIAHYYMYRCPKCSCSIYGPTSKTFQCPDCNCKMIRA